MIQDYQLNKIIITSAKEGNSLESLLEGQIADGTGLDVSRGVLELDLYEDLSMPFINGKLIVGDTDAIISSRGINGNEFVIIEIESRSNPESKINRVMMISDVSDVIKANEQSDVYVFELTDPFAWISKCIQVSRYYKGPPLDIIRKIFSDYPLNVTIDERYGQYNLNGNIIRASLPSQKDIQIITPWWEPLKTIEWIRDRCTNSGGYPFMVYASIFDNSNRVIIENLSDILKETSAYNNKTIIANPHNVISKKPIVYSLHASDENNIESYFAIEKYSRKNIYSIINLVKSGSLGSYLGVFDLNRGSEVYGEHHDITESIFGNINTNINPVRPAIARAETPFQQDLIDNSFEINGTKLRDIDSRRFYKTISTGQFAGVAGYSDEPAKDASYKTMIQNKAIRNVLKREALSIQMPGALFLANKKSIGGLLDVNFLKVGGIDEDVSGRYAVISMRHVFRDGLHTVSAELTRIAPNK